MLEDKNALASKISYTDLQMIFEDELLKSIPVINRYMFPLCFFELSFILLLIVFNDFAISFGLISESFNKFCKINLLEEMKEFVT